MHCKVCDIYIVRTISGDAICQNCESDQRFPVQYSLDYNSFDVIRKELEAVKGERDDLHNKYYALTIERDLLKETFGVQEDILDMIHQDHGELKVKLTTAIKMLKHYGPEPLGHVCGPETNCDQLCADYANFQKTLAELKGDE